MITQQTNLLTIPAVSPNGVASRSRDAALRAVVGDIRRRFGDGAIFRLGETSHLYCQAIPTGFPALDAALGVGGLPRGRIVDVFGPEQSGKTTLCLSVIAQIQANGGQAVFVDTDNSFNPTWAARWGVDIEALYLGQPGHGEEALEIADCMIRAMADVVVIDSAAALVTRAELQGDMGDDYRDYGALMAQAMRKLAGIARKNDSLVIFTNQLRNHGGFVAYETTTGGRALRYYAAARLDLRRVMAIKAGSQVIGTRHRVVVKKNKVAPPFGACEFDIMTEADGG